ncbi:response regulator [Marinifilum sp. JC120]|nr:response regulator [Marinifilum sp. JC120]
MPNKVLIIDDDLFFRDALKDELTDEYEYEVRTLDADIDAIGKIVLTWAPTFIVLDNFIGPYSAINLMKKLHEAHGIDWTKQKVIIVTGQDQNLLEELDDSFDILLKPIDPSELIDVFNKHIDKNWLNKIRNIGQYTPPKELQKLPIALRILNKDGNIIYRNGRWTGPHNRPYPKRFIPFPQAQKLDTKEFWGPLPDQPGKIGPYRVRSFSPSDEDKNHLVQIAESLPFDKSFHFNNDKEKDYIELAFETLENVGLTKGKYFTISDIPGTPGVISPYTSEDDVPYKKILGGPLRSSLNKLMKDIDFSKDKEVIQDEIKLSNCEKDQDCNFVVDLFQNLLVPTEKVQVIPILGKNSLDELKALGVFLFPEFDSKRLADGEGAKGHIKSVSQTLIHAFRGIAWERSKRYERDELNCLRQINNLDSKFNESMNVHDSLQVLLDEAVKLTKADGGFISLAKERGSSLEIEITNGHIQKSFKNIQHTLPPKELTLPSEQCWATKKSRFIPEIKPSDRKIFNEAYSKTFNQIEKNNKLQQWVQSELKSLTTSLVFSGDTAIGVLALHWNNNFQYTNADKNIIEHLLLRAKWFLQSATAEETRRLWERTLMHDIRSEIGPIRHTIDTLNNHLPEATFTPQLQSANLHLQAISDVIEDFRDSQQDIIADKNSSFNNPLEIIENAISLHQERQKRRNHYMSITPCNPESEIWKKTLIGNKNTVERIVRNFISNAMKRSKKGEPISINCSLENKQWRLDVYSHSSMSPEEYELRFVPHKRAQEHLRQDGAHIGLYIGKKWAEEYGGKLELENDPINGQERVRASLHWPLAEHGGEKSYDKL